MNFSFHPAARQEFIEAIAYYEDFREGLGLEFAREIFFAIDRIVRFPEAWSEFSSETRRCLISRFPYGVIYQIFDEEVLIIAIAQLNREPNYWTEGRV